MQWTTGTASSCSTPAAVKLQISGEEKANITVPDLIGHFSVKTDRMLLAN
jgi:cobalamin biosynthesis protein CbiD